MCQLLRVCAQVQHLIISKCMSVKTVCTSTMPVKDLRNDNDLFGGWSSLPSTPRLLNEPGRFQVGRFMSSVSPDALDGELGAWKSYRKESNQTCIISYTKKIPTFKKSWFCDNQNWITYNYIRQDKYSLNTTHRYKDPFRNHGNFLIWNNAEFEVPTERYVSLATCFHVGILIGLFYSEDGDNMFIWNVGWLSTD
jgi:hypothetical protein